VPARGKLSESALIALLNAPGGPVARDLYQRGLRVQNRARTLAPVDTGRLRNSIIVEARTGADGPVVAIGSRLEYAIFVHEGTGLFGSGRLIKPRNARVLRWPARSGTGARVRGAFVFAKYSRGSPGRPFLTNALPAAA
jgi:bacteriophage HK97-gp10 putative tail-component